MPDRFNSCEEVSFDPNHPSFIRGGEAWSKGALLDENPFEPWEYNYKAWQAGWVDMDAGWNAEQDALAHSSVKRLMEEA